MTPAFQKLFLALFVCITLQLSLSVPVEAAHGDSHIRRSLTHKKRVVVDRSLKNVGRDGLLDGVDSLVGLETQSQSRPSLGLDQHQ